MTRSQEELNAVSYAVMECIRRGIVRTGSCTMCGACCWIMGGHMNFGFNHATGELILQGVSNSHRCRGYDPKTHKCDSHDNDKWWLCSTFPLLPEHLIFVSDVCGYHFERV